MGIRALGVFERALDTGKNGHGWNAQLMRFLTGCQERIEAASRNAGHRFYGVIGVDRMDKEWPDQILGMQSCLTDKTAKIFGAPDAAGTLQDRKIHPATLQSHRCAVKPDANSNAKSDFHNARI